MKPVGRAPATGVEWKGRQEKAKQQGKKTEDRDPSPRKEDKMGIWF